MTISLPKREKSSCGGPHDDIEFQENQINPWHFEKINDVAWRLSRRAIVDCAEYDYHMAVGGFSDPTMAEQIEALHPDQVRGLCIMLAQMLARTEVALHAVDHDDEEAVFIAVGEYNEITRPTL